MKPKAKTSKIVIQKTDKELLLYNLSIDHAFCLNVSAVPLAQGTKNNVSKTLDKK
jgi:hypothetical protein